MAESETPKWVRELEIFSSVKPMLILEGNVLDKYQTAVHDGNSSLVSLSEFLYDFFAPPMRGGRTVVFYSNLVGFVNPYNTQDCEKYAELTASECKNGTIAAEFKGNTSLCAPAIIMRAMMQDKTPTVTVLEMASHYMVTPDRMDQHDVNAFNLLLQAALSSHTVKTTSGKHRNLLIIIANKLNDLPPWLYLNNPSCKSIHIDTPDWAERRHIVSSLFPAFFDSVVYRKEIQWWNEHPQDTSSLQDRFAALTDGLTNTEIEAIRQLSLKEKSHISSLCSMVELYKYGVKENPWETLDMDSLRCAKADFEKRIKGQDAALERTLDVIKRAVTGMNGIASSSTSASKPKGVLFFAGPTGTGKTETAKALAEKLFGDESACIRFDMSEYGQSHSDQKLMGAPPGYVGYEAGGQLTNAVKKNPFCILLFDEIEKAHPSILDKFLQILEDGRMTDGQGSTVYFSEAVIIFTSNLGMYVRDDSSPSGRRANVTADMNYDEVQSRIRSSVDDYFKLELGRPEILNRIGENIVVFDFIRKPAGKAILKSQVDKILSRMESDKNLHVAISAAAYDELEGAALSDLSNGGRGIGNQVENLLINPLSRWLFDSGILRDSTITITHFDTAACPPSIECAMQGGNADE